MKEQDKKYIHWSAAIIESTIEQFVQAQGRLPVAREMNQKNGLPSRRTFERIMGMTWGKYAKLHYPELARLGEERHKRLAVDIKKELSEWTEEKLIAAVKHFVEQHGRLPFIQEYIPENHLPSYTTFRKIAEQTMADKLKRHFQEKINHNHARKTNNDQQLKTIAQQIYIMDKQTFEMSIRCLLSDADMIGVDHWIEFAEGNVSLEQYVDFEPVAQPVDVQMEMERWLGSLFAGLEQIKQIYGKEIAEKIWECGIYQSCLYPYEMLPMAEHLQKGGVIEDVNDMIDEGMLEPEVKKQGISCETEPFHQKFY